MPSNPWEPRSLAYHGPFSSQIAPDRDDAAECVDTHWKINVPNGVYFVEVGYSDPGYDTDTSGCTLNGASASIGTVPAGQSLRYDVFPLTVTDNYITFAGEYGTGCQAISFIHISQETIDEIWGELLDNTAVDPTASDAVVGDNACASFCSDVAFLEIRDSCVPTCSDCTVCAWLSSADQQL